MCADVDCFLTHSSGDYLVCRHHVVWRMLEPELHLCVPGVTDDYTFNFLMPSVEDVVINYPSIQRQNPCANLFISVVDWLVPSDGTHHECSPVNICESVDGTAPMVRSMSQHSNLQ